MRSRMIVMPALAVLVGAVGGCVPQPAPPTAATGAQLTDAIGGKSYVGTMPDGSAVCVYHAPDGRFLGRADGLVSGRWTIEDDSLCYAYAVGPDRPDCRQVVTQGDRVAFVFAELVIGLGRLTEGNVCA